MIQPKALVIFFLKVLVRLTIAKFLFVSCMDRVIVNNKLEWEHLKNPVTFLLFFLFVIVAFVIPYGNSNRFLLISTSNKMEDEMKRGNDLKEKELKMQQDSMEAIANTFKNNQNGNTSS